MLMGINMYYVLSFVLVFTLMTFCEVKETIENIKFCIFKLEIIEYMCYQKGNYIDGNLKKGQTIKVFNDFVNKKYELLKLDSANKLIEKISDENVSGYNILFDKKKLYVWFEKEKLIFYCNYKIIENDKVKVGDEVLGKINISDQKHLIFE